MSVSAVRRWWPQLGRIAGLALLAVLALQLYFLLRIALMALILPSSTSFQRSEAWHLLVNPETTLTWRQTPVAGERIANSLRRAVIASEDAGFTEHDGVEWEAIEKARVKNERAEARTEAANARALERAARKAGRSSDDHPPAAPALKQAKLVGASTISQQLAKNLFLSGERTVLRKGQELLITLALEALLDKGRILDLYLSSVEWGQGVFGAEAAAQRYFHRSAATLSTAQAARLAVMLPAPKRFEKNPSSGYVLGRAATIQARMRAVQLP